MAVSDGMSIERDARVRLPGDNEWLTVRFTEPAAGGGLTVGALSDVGQYRERTLSAVEASLIRLLEHDGGADSERVLAAVWASWMAAASGNADTTLLASVPLRPYVHQSNAVYGAMLPQPQMRMLLGDEPGTGKTIMAGLYIREMQRLGLLSRALVVAPAGLIEKWQDDWKRFFGGELKRITADTVSEGALDLDHDVWVVSLHLAASNRAVQEAIIPERAGWQVVVFDEAHRLSPLAPTMYRVGRLLADHTPRALLMTATPHRGSEWLFRHLMHLVDPDVYSDPGDDPKAELPALKPGGLHFLRRMKEDLVDYDGETKLFKGRRASNHLIPLSPDEYTFYEQAIALVDEFFPDNSKGLARMVYGKRGASSLYALSETLRRRAERMGSENAVAARHEADPDNVDESSADEAEVITADSLSARVERTKINTLLAQMTKVLSGGYTPSKWPNLIDKCFAANGILPGNGEQAVVFTEFADSAEWIVDRLRTSGFTAEMYSGRMTSEERTATRKSFMRREFQIIVSTDAGNEGIDLQSAHVLVNYDIPWSLVRLEQRMGRIHRVGQTRDVELYNLIASDTREGDTLATLLNNFVTAANELDGQMFDSLSLVAELSGVNYTGILQDLYADDEAAERAKAAAKKVKDVELARVAREARKQEAALSVKVDAAAALDVLRRDVLQRINPAIVERFLALLSDAGVLQTAPAPQGDGIVRISRSQPLPATLGGSTSALVATSGKALAEAEANADIANVVPVGPGEAAFADLIRLATDDLNPDLYRGGPVADPTSVTDYDLYAYQGVLTEAGGSRTTPWAVLVKVDNVGARVVSWETLANLVPSDKPGKPEHPARNHQAQTVAMNEAARIQDLHTSLRQEWFTSARADLERLPALLTAPIPNAEQRREERKRLTEKIAKRAAGLQMLAEVSISDVKQFTRLTVHAAGVPLTPQEKDSEMIAMALVEAHLAAQGWKVADVHLDGLGYDLRAVRGREQRIVEVKGVWGLASSTGIRMTGNEVLMATQHRQDFWLYVVHQCADGGALYGAYSDPITTFRSDIKGDAVFTVPGSALAAARQEGPS
jgi:superfamily II DNA or RNA helicase